MHLKLLLKRGGLLAAANWPVVAIQFVAQATFQALMAVPIVGAAILVAVLLGGDLANLLQGSMRDIFTSITSTLVAEPFAFFAFIAAFLIVLVGGSILMFLVKGGTVDVMLAANDRVGAIERQPLTLTALSAAAAFSVAGFVHGCGRLFSRYLRLGMLLMVAYGMTGAAYLAFIVYGYRAAGSGVLFVGWTVLAAVATFGLFLWITAVNLAYLLVQIALADSAGTLREAIADVARFTRTEFRELSGVFLVVFGMVVAAWLASALAWSGVGLIAFVPLIGLAVLPLQIVALLVRGFIFEYIGLTAMGAYVTMYRRHATAAAPAVALNGDPSLHPVQ